MCKCVQFANLGDIALSSKNLANFKLSLRSEVRRYWNGQVGKSDFVFNFHNAIDRGFNRAFNIGIAECGKKRDDLSDKELDALQDKINSQFEFVSNLADAIVQKKDGGKFNEQVSRLSNWYPRFGEMVQLGKVTACGDELLEWVLGVAEHCESCKSLAGIVKPASFWNEKGVLPAVAGADYLICKGYNCQCGLKRTSKKETKGNLPSLP